jgi:glutathionylspermidine amidase/synthetase
VIEETPGKWGEDKNVYQVLCPLPRYGEDNVQVCCFAVNGTYGGTVLRVDKSKIIGMESSVYCLRAVPDEQLATI